MVIISSELKVIFIAYCPHFSSTKKYSSEIVK